MKRFFEGAALFISHYMSEDEESHTDSATVDDNGLHFWLSLGNLTLMLYWSCSVFYKSPV